MNEHIKKLNEYFREFIEDPTIKDELIFCLTQSQVELFIRFKFAFWISKKYVNPINLVETNRIDLINQIENYKYCIEFGHQINLLKHSPYRHVKDKDGKVHRDCHSLKEKIISLSNKIPAFFENEPICCCTITLFTDFHLMKKDDNKSNLFLAKYFDSNDVLNCGVLAKYGKSISIKQDEVEYNTDYRKELKECEFHSLELIEDKLSFHWKIEECPATKIA